MKLLFMRSYGHFEVSEQAKNHIMHVMFIKYEQKNVLNFNALCIRVDYLLLNNAMIGFLSFY